jgi:LmbE family N-acetylglucosaminyl deacetylase
VLFTHWPVDTHMDHQVASFLTMRAWMSLGQRSHLYFFEVDTGYQTEGFKPDTYIDVSSVLEKKRAALVAHVSQNGEQIWREHHEIISRWRGREAGLTAAEAFVHVSRDSKTVALPGL